MHYIYILCFPIIIYLVNKFIELNKLLPSLSGEKHQLFVEKINVPLSGGVIMLVIFFIITDFNFDFFYIFFILIFFIGFFSDLKIIKSPRLRFLLQLLLIFLFIIYYDLQILNLRIFFIDIFLQNKIFSYFFVMFCILIIVNGTNFIDGLNGLVLGYFFVVLMAVYNLDLLANVGILKIQTEYFLIFFIYLILFNLFNKLYIGDGGSYFLGFIFGVLSILIYRYNVNISPLFIVLLLWYPCFENLFSIIRKYKFNLSPLASDNKHFHQLLYYFFKKKASLSNLTSNNLSSLSINLFNFLAISIGSIDIYNTQLQIAIVLFNVTIYIILYSKLFNFRFKKKIK